MSEDVAPDEPQGDPPPTSKPRRHWARRWARRAGLMLLGVLLLVVGLLVAVVYTAAGTELALSTGLAIYSDMIPGDAQADEIDGALADGVSVRGVRLLDRFGRPLVEADRLELSVDPGRALSLMIDPGTIRVTNLRVYALSYDDGGFGDLGPEGPPPPDESVLPPFGPDLPIDIDAALEVTNAMVLTGRPSAPVVTVFSPQLDLRLRGGGTDARAELAAQLSMPTEGLDVYRIATEVAWADPAVTIASLRVEANAGTIELNGAHLDLARESFAVDRLRALPSASWLAERTGLVAREDTELTVELAGSTSDFSVDVVASLPVGGGVTATIYGALAPYPDVDFWIDAHIDEPFAIAETELPPMLVNVLGHAAGEDAGTDMAVELTCRGCVENFDPLELRAEAFVGGRGMWGSAHAQVTAPEAAWVATAAANPDGTVALASELDAPRLAALNPLLERIAGGTRVAGELHAEIACAAVLEPRAGICRANVDLERGRPIERVHLDAAVAPQGVDGIAVELRDLLVAAHDVRNAGDVRIAQQGGPATVDYSPRGVGVRGFAVEVTTRSGTGRVDVDGALILTEPAAASANVRVRRLALAAANTFAPDLRAQGLVSASVGVEGLLSDPALQARVEGTGLGVMGLRVGDLRVDASYRGDEARAALHVRGEDVGEVELDARAPVELDLAAGEVLLHPDRPVHAALRVGGLPLSAAGTLVPGFGDLRGTVDLDAALGRTLRRPRASVEGRLTHARLGDKLLPDVELAAGYDRELATARVRATHATAFDALRVDAEVPVRADLSRGRVRWLPAKPHRVELGLDGGELEEVRRWMDGFDATGRVDVDANITGTMLEPVLTAQVRGRRLAFRKQAVGKVSVGLGYADEQASLQLTAAGPDVAGIGVVAEVPVTVVPAKGRVQWHQEKDHRLRVSVNEVVIERAMRWASLIPTEPGAEPLPNLGGRLDAELEVNGAASDPTIAMSATVHRGEYEGRRLGKLAVNAGYADKHASGSLHWNKSTGHSARVDVAVPVGLDLPAGGVDWRRDEAHHLAVAVPRIDRELLDPFVDLGELRAATSLYLIADGHLDAFEVDAALRGTITSGKRRHRLHVDVEANQSEQRVELDIGTGGKGWGRAVAVTKAAVPAIARGADWRPTPLEVHADMDNVDLRVFEGMTPLEIQDVRGRMTVDAGVGGTLGEPRLDGKIALRDGEVTVVPARARLKRLEVIADLSNEHLNLTRLSFATGGGNVGGTGRVTVATGAGVTGSIDLEIREIPVRSPGLPRMTVTSDVHTELDVGLDAVGIDVRIAEAKVDVQTQSITAAAPIPTNENVGYVDFDDPRPQDVLPEDQPARPPSRRTQIKVALVDPVRIVGPAVDMSWGGAIAATTGPAGSSTSGKLQAAKGYFDLLGNKFDVERGTVTLSEDGSGLPFLDVVAHTSVDDARITATIRGQLPKPELKLSSSPAMTESEIFTVLVTGSTDTQSADPDEVEAKAASVLAAMSNPALQRQLNDKLKVDRVGVGFGESTDQPILTVGKNVTKKVYAETQYHHNAPKNENRAELRVEYRFAPRWSLETFFGDAAAGGVDVFWGRAFDTDPNKRRRPKSR